MVRPGVNVISRATPPARSRQATRGRIFMAQVADEGPANTPLSCRNLGDFVRLFGPRIVASPAYDCADLMFREGAPEIYFSRVVGPTPVKATFILTDRAGAPLNTLAIDAIGPGAYGLTISVQVVNGSAANSYVLVIFRSGVEVERSPDLFSPTDGVAWATASSYVRARDLASATAAPNNIPAVRASTALAGAATDDRGNITDVQRTAALTAFGPDLGSGLVVYPGGTTATIHAALRTAARNYNREALCDMPDTATEATLTALVAGINEEYSAAFAPWIVIPGIVTGTTRIVPPSALVAGLIARAESNGVSPNRPAAGAQGVSRYALGVSQAYDDATFGRLALAGVNVTKMVNGTVRLYGYRTNANPQTNPQWIGLGNQRLRLAITEEVLAMGENFALAEIDGRGQFFAEVAGAVGAILQRYYNAGSIYGATPSEAYSVDTGPAVNTPVTIANNELHVVVAAKMSPFAEYSLFEVVKVGITDVL